MKDFWDKSTNYEQNWGRHATLLGCSEWWFRNEFFQSAKYLGYPISSFHSWRAVIYKTVITQLVDLKSRLLMTSGKVSLQTAATHRNYCLLRKNRWMDVPHTMGKWTPQDVFWTIPSIYVWLHGVRVARFVDFMEFQPGAWPEIFHSIPSYVGVAVISTKIQNKIRIWLSLGCNDNEGAYYQLI